MSLVVLGMVLFALGRQFFVDRMKNVNEMVCFAVMQYPFSFCSSIDSM